MTTLTCTTPLYSTDFQTLSDKLYQRIWNRRKAFDDVWERSYELSHDEMVSLALLEVLADQYGDLDCETRECLVMMYIENQVSFE